MIGHIGLGTEVGHLTTHKEFTKLLKNTTKLLINGKYKVEINFYYDHNILAKCPKSDFRTKLRYLIWG